MLILTEYVAETGEALQSLGLNNKEITDAKRELEKLPGCMATNMAEGGYRGVGGFGNVHHCGVRFRYSESKLSGASHP